MSGTLPTAVACELQPLRSIDTFIERHERTARKAGHTEALKAYVRGTRRDQKLSPGPR